jgi:SMC interacting uncharacterized protein involved in chromosome segregation
LKNENHHLTQKLDRMVLEVQNLNERIKLQKNTQKQLFKELDCSIIAHEKSVASIRLSSVQGTPVNGMARLSVGEAHFDTSMTIVNTISSIEAQLVKLQTERDQLVNEKQILRQEIEEQK